MTFRWPHLCTPSRHSDASGSPPYNRTASNAAIRLSQQLLAARHAPELLSRATPAAHARTPHASERKAYGAPPCMGRFATLQAYLCGPLACSDGGVWRMRRLLLPRLLLHALSECKAKAEGAVRSTQTRRGGGCETYGSARAPPPLHQAHHTTNLSIDVNTKSHNMMSACFIALYISLYALLYRVTDRRAEAVQCADPT